MRDKNRILKNWGIIFSSSKLFPFVLLFLCVLTYGLLIPYLGFFWDDFPYLWFDHVAGPVGTVKALALDRPILGVFYILPLSILGESPIVWHFFSILCRWIFILSVFSFLNQVFPKHKTYNKFIILLFLVYPGFSQQYISVVYSHAFLIFALYFYSLFLFSKSIRTGKFIWLGLISIVLSLICMAATEYVVGLEILKPLIIYKSIIENHHDSNLVEKIKKSIFLWMPYFVAGLLFVIYRIFFASSVLYKFQQLDKIAASPLETFCQFISKQFMNIYRATFMAWGQIFNPLSLMDSSSLFSILYIFILAIVAILSFFLIFHFTRRMKIIKIEKPYFFQLLIGSLLTLICAGMPFWAANLQPALEFPSDRFLLPFMLGASIILFLVILFISRNRAMFSIIFGGILGLSVSFQIHQANNYRNEWDSFRDFMDQISWRIPSLEENTLLVTDELPLKFYSDNSLTAAINWVYADRFQKGTLPYLINYTKARLGKSLPSLNPDTRVVHNYRTHVFSGNTNQMILFYHQPPGCVHIADPELDVYNPLISPAIRPSMSLSRPDLILLDEKQEPAFFLSNTHPETWCYYYQKASLYVANQNWKKAAELGDIAFALDDYPNDASERVPFIEAYAMDSQWEKAINLTKITYQVSNLYQPMLCELWERILERTDSNISVDQTQQIKNSVLFCN